MGIYVSTTTANRTIMLSPFLSQQELGNKLLLLSHAHHVTSTLVDRTSGVPSGNVSR